MTFGVSCHAFEDIILAPKAIRSFHNLEAANYKLQIRRNDYEDELLTKRHLGCVKTIPWIFVWP